MKKSMFLVFAAVWLILIFFGCALDDASRKKATVPVIPGASHIGSDACFGCHSELEGPFGKTVHGRIADFEVVNASMGCESCHRPGSLHAESGGDPSQIISFKDISKGQASAICLECHTSGKHMDWHGSGHDINEVCCVDCHQMMSPKEKQLVKQQPDLCYDCHKRIRSKTLYPSHHPIREGKMACSDCHRPHGGFTKNLKTKERKNDLCLDCHAAKQGPFIFEHAPVVEDCTICHEPHGAVANNLLLKNEPFLCLQCHQFHFHPGKIGDEGASTDVYDRPVSSCNEGMTIAYTTKCTQCHSRIHGSDLPSQSVPGQGGALTR
ncbi:MAG: GSU2203 family decaheme c-type cytochrome [Desulfobacterales bacterium]